MLELSFADCVHTPDVCLRTQNHRVPGCMVRSPGTDISHGMTYRTSTVDWRNTLIRVKTLFGARIVAVGPYGKKAAREKADETKVTWNGMD